MKYVTKDYIFCLDGDGQYNPLPIELPDKDTIINGYKINRKDPPLRIAMSKLSNFIAKVFFNVNYNDMNSGYKIFHKNIIPLFNKVKHMILSPWGEFLIRAHYEGYNIKDIGIKHNKRLHGSSKLMKSIAMVSYTNGTGGTKLFYELFSPIVKGIIITQWLNLTKRNSTYIIDHIYIGGYGHSELNHKIDVRELPNGFSYYSLRSLDKFVDIVNDTRGWVVVYCKRGMVRSATVIAGYLIKYRNYTVNEAVNLIKSKRRFTVFGHHNMRTLREYKKKLEINQ